MMRKATFNTAKFAYWDIESLSNVFTLAVYTQWDHGLHVFYLVDPGSVNGYSPGLLADPGTKARVLERVRAANPAWVSARERAGLDPAGGLHLYDLSTFDANHRLARIMGLSDASSVNDPRSASSYPGWYRPVCDTDTELYDPTSELTPFLAGYNSRNYDTVMLSLYLCEVMGYTIDVMGRCQDKALRRAGLPPHAQPGPDLSAAVEREVLDLLPKEFTPTSASLMRSHSDALFSEEYKAFMPSYLTQGPPAGGEGWSSQVHLVRQSMLCSGRHIDVAQLNEAQHRVGLKRLLGMLGFQILESDRLTGASRVDDLDSLVDLVSYNVSDVVNLASLMAHPLYAGAFDLKHGLMTSWPETVYDRVGKGSSVPDQRPESVRRSRLVPDSTSARFVSYILAPYDALDDIETVSFMYPSQRVADQKGIERIDVLEAAREFFYEQVSDETARAAFDEVYQFYASIRGKNFNRSEEYRRRWLSGPEPSVLCELPMRANNLPYFDSDGAPTSCFATFSTGGIHGAEADVGLHRQDNASERELADLIDQVRQTLGVTKTSDAEAAMAVRIARQVTLPSSRVVRWQEVLKTSSSPDPSKGSSFKQVKPDKPLFAPNGRGGTRLSKRYAFTSVGLAAHQDFSSYYPSLLSNLDAFYNEALGEDRYKQIYSDKERFGALEKDKSLTPDVRLRYHIRRNGTKLVLNTASGAGDTDTGRSTIRMNNMIISMRLIGQVFSWWIGQAQTLAGARIMSTNTDGLYSRLSEVFDMCTGNRILEEESRRILVLIEPEKVLLVSKDSNNRVEFAEPDPDDPAPWESTPVLSASGASLACWQRPRPDKSLAHPAVLDRVLVEYLRHVATGYVTPDGRALSIDRPMDRDLVTSLVSRLVAPPDGSWDGFDTVESLLLFQNVVAASQGSITYPFASDPVPPGQKDSPEAAARGARSLQHYNRVFVVSPGTPGAVSLRSAGSWVVSKVVRDRRERDGLPVVNHDPTAVSVLAEMGLVRNRAELAARPGASLLPVDQDVAVRKIPGIEPTWHILILNRDLHEMPEELRRRLLASLDVGTYVSMLVSTFEENWMNRQGAGGQQ